MGELDLRISDGDRERAAAVLHAAVGDGRLTWAEHDERVTRAYAARTRADLVPLFADLPVPGRAPAAGAVSAPARAATEPLRVAFGKVRRRPDPADGAAHVEVLLGAAVLDLRDLPRGAVFDVVAHTLLGKVEVWVPAGTRIVDTGTANLGKRTTVERRGARAGAGGGGAAGVGVSQRARRVVPGPDAPVVRVGGHSVLGHVRVTLG